MGSPWDRTPERAAPLAEQGAAVASSPAEATEGRLEIFVGATDEDFERVRPILEPLGTVRRTGARDRARP